MYDPSLLYSPSTTAVTLLCTNDAANIIPPSKAAQEQASKKLFKSRDAQYPRMDFKGIDIFRSPEEIITLSQQAYVNKINIGVLDPPPPKEEMSRNMDFTGILALRSTAGKIAWLATGTSPLSSYHASVALQRYKEQLIPSFQILQKTKNALMNIQSNCKASLNYVQLDEETIHIWVYTDGSYQNLETKHSQIGFIIGLADKDDHFNIFH